MTDAERPDINERYRAAIHTSNLGSDPRSFRSPSDVLGAMGLADKRLTDGWVTTGPDNEGYDIKPAPLAVPLARLLAGDHKAAHEIVRILAEMVWSKADNDRTKPKVSRPEAHDMACACLAWHQHGTCKHCGGHGYSLIPGVPSLSAHECEHCHGGKIPLHKAFDPQHRYQPRLELARWLLAEMERAMGRAGPEAMKAIAPRLDL